MHGWLLPLLLVLLQVVVQHLQQLFPSSSPYIHTLVDTAVILPGRGPLDLDLDAAGAHYHTAQSSISTLIHSQQNKPPCCSLPSPSMTLSISTCLPACTASM